MSDNEKMFNFISWDDNAPTQADITTASGTFNFVVGKVSRQDREKILEGYDLKKFAKVFEDEELMKTCECLFANNLNVSRAATLLYMHRNTLIYRLKKLKRTIGLDLCDFYQAIIFKILYIFYCEK